MNVADDKRLASDWNICLLMPHYKLYSTFLIFKNRILRDENCWAVETHTAAMVMYIHNSMIERRDWLFTLHTFGRSIYVLTGSKASIFARLLFSLATHGITLQWSYI